MRISFNAKWFWRWHWHFFFWNLRQRLNTLTSFYRMELGTWTAKEKQGSYYSAETCRHGWTYYCSLVRSDCAIMLLKWSTGFVNPSARWSRLVSQVRIIYLQWQIYVSRPLGRLRYFKANNVLNNNSFSQHCNNTFYMHQFTHFGW